MSIEVNSRIGAKNSEITELQNQQNSLALHSDQILYTRKHSEANSEPAWRWVYQNYSFLRNWYKHKIAASDTIYYIITHPIDLSGANKLRSFLQYSQEKNIC